MSGSPVPHVLTMESRTPRTESRLFVQGPYPDESVSSLLKRAGALYGIFYEDLVTQLYLRAGFDPRPASTLDMDNPDRELRDLLTDALGLKREALDTCVIQNGMQWLDPSARSAYCPVCFLDDRQAGRSPYFRRRWALVWKTMCEIHCMPLEECPWAYYLPAQWQIGVTHQSPLPASAFRNQMQILIEPLRRHWQRQTWEGFELAAKLLGWEYSRITEQASAPDSMSPAMASNTTASLRCAARLVSVFGVNRLSSVERVCPPAGKLIPTPGGWWLSYRRLHMDPIDPKIETPWTRFCSISDPAIRRGALALAAVTMEKDWQIAEILGIPVDIPSASERWWAYIDRYVAQGCPDDALDDLRAARCDLGLPSRAPRIRLPIQRRDRKGKLVKRSPGASKNDHRIASFVRVRYVPPKPPKRKPRVPDWLPTGGPTDPSDDPTGLKGSYRGLAGW